jgi:hypothetical protein
MSSKKAKKLRREAKEHFGIPKGIPYSQYKPYYKFYKKELDKVS